MTAPLRLSPVASARLGDGTGGAEKSFRKSRRLRAGARVGVRLGDEAAERAWFARMLWRAFPEADSENALAHIAAGVLSREGRPVTPRAVRNWLRAENTPHFRYVLAVMALVGAEAVFARISGEG